MGKKDVIAKEYLATAERIADFLTRELFGGSRTIFPSDILEMDSAAAGIYKEKNTVINVRVSTKDLVRGVRFGLHVLLLSVEEQSDIHYAMPLKVMKGDTAIYDRQWRSIRRKHQQKKDLAGAEYLSGFGKDDRLFPVLTMVLYFGEKEWDGPVCLKDMMDLNVFPPEVRRHIADYPIYLVQVRRYPHPEYFRTDLKCVFGFLKYTSDPEGLKTYIKKNEEDFTHLSEDAYDMIAVMSKTKALENLKKDANKEEEEYDMCYAIDMLEKQSEERGIKLGTKRGIKRGIKLGTEQGIKLAKDVFLLSHKGASREEIAKRLKLSIDEVRNILDEEIN